MLTDIHKSIDVWITTKTEATAVQFSPVYEIVGFFFAMVRNRYNYEINMIC
jgi:hypothetical protein